MLLVLLIIYAFSVLVNNGLLQCRDIGSWWLGIPGAGVFMKHFTKGRQTILRMIKRRKFKEILQQVKPVFILILLLEPFQLNYLLQLNCRI